MKAAKRMLALISLFVALIAFTAVVYGTQTEGAAAEATEAAPNTVSVTITEETFFSFTPNATGYWTFVTSDNTEDTAPRLWLTNHYGHLLAINSGSAPGNNAIIKLHLVEGAPYVIRAGFDCAALGSYVLNVFMSEEFVRPVRPTPVPVVIPGEGGTVSDGDLYYSFTPYESGLWLFNFENDALLELQIRDSRRNDIAFNFDFMASGFYGTVRLTAGEEYIIRSFGTMIAVDAVSYTLSVTPAEEFVPWINWDILSIIGLDMDFEADRLAIPPYGGDEVVTEATMFSFTPDTTGLWVFSLTDIVTRSGIIAFITDAYGSFAAVMDGSPWWEDQVVLSLEEGVEYVILVSPMFAEAFTSRLIVESYEDWEPDYDYDNDTAPVVKQGVRIPPGGGYITGISDDFLFIPEHIGPWSIQLLGTPGWFLLGISDPSESLRLSESALPVISLHLAAGVEYTITTRSGNAIHVSPTYEIHPPHGGTHIMRRVVREAEFSFIPAETGYWVIFTSDNTGTTDPYLWLIDAEGNIVASNDDGGEGFNSLIKIFLEAGTEYIIRAGFFAGEGTYILNVHMAGDMLTSPELVVLEPPAQ